MDYQRIYWSGFVGIGLVFAVPALSTLRTESSLPVVLMAVVGVGMVITGGYELFAPNERHTPTPPDWQFFAVVLGFVLAVAGFAVGALA